MKRLLAYLAICASLSASAQVVYPYNPDANGDSQITSGDLLDFLPVFATSFTPQIITIDGVPLDEWLDGLEEVVNSNAAAIESLFEMQAQINSLEAANNDLQAQINSLQSQLDNLSFSVDGLPPCLDIDVDGICDYADACTATAIQFTYSIDSFDYESDYILANGTYEYAQLQGADLSDACLLGINLHHAFLTSANLSGANLSGAELFSASFYQSNLTGANLSGADLYYVSFEQANLEGANLSGTNLVNASFSNANLSGANLASANVYVAYFYGADLTGADLSDATNLSDATMTCLQGCPSLLPSGYVCEPDPDCTNGGDRIVPD